MTKENKKLENSESMCFWKEAELKGERATSPIPTCTRRKLVRSALVTCGDAHWMFAAFLHNIAKKHVFSRLGVSFCFLDVCSRCTTLRLHGNVVCRPCYGGRKRSSTSCSGNSARKS